MAHHDHDMKMNNSTTFRMFLTMAMNFIITIAEIIGGIISGSLALISDAMHNLTDGIAIIISYIALKLRKAKTSSRHTFGLKRAEIFAAVINATVLFFVSIFLFYEAIKRFITPHPIEGHLMIIVASIGLVANVTGTLLLHRDSKTNINIKSAYLHLFVDSLSSVTVIIGGILIAVYSIYWIDPLLTILIALYVLKESLVILKESSHILMEGTPHTINPDKIQKDLEKIPEVSGIHHIHIWSIGEKDIHFESHVDVSDMLISETQSIQDKIEQILSDYGITHVTLQFECDICHNKNLINEH